MPLDTFFNTQSMLTALIHKSVDYDLFMGTLRDKVKEYERRVWSDGLQDVVEKHPARGMCGRLGTDVKLMTYVMAGRVMTTFEHKGGHWATVLSGEGEKPSRMGFHGISGTVQQAMDLLQLAIDTWEAEGISMVVDTEVTLDVLAALQPPTPKPRMARILDRILDLD